MSEIFSPTFLSIIDTLCQVILTVAAIVAIIITIKQIQSKRMSEIKASYVCGKEIRVTGENESQIVDGVCITLRNIGLGPVYYEDCGLLFTKDKKVSKKKHYPGVMVNRPLTGDGVIRPGDSICESIYWLGSLMKCVENEYSISADEYVYIYLDLCNGKRLTYPTGDTIKSLLGKYNSISQQS